MVKIRLKRLGYKKNPFYRIVVADSRRARDGRFVEKIGTYNPFLEHDNPERVVLKTERAKYWLSVGAQPSDRVALFLAGAGLIDKPVINETPKKSAPKKKAQEKMKAAAAAADN